MQTRNAADNLYLVDHPEYFSTQKKDLLRNPTGRGPDTSIRARRERFWEKVNRIDSACWEWLGARGHAGYGRHYIAGICQTAHRAAWFLEYGQLPDGELDHLCKNRACVRLDHLRAVPAGFNVMQGHAEWNRMRAMNEHCVHGHSCGLTSTTKGDRRRCLECQRIACRKWYRSPKGR